MYKKTAFIFLIIFSLSIVISGCQNTAQKKPQTPKQEINQTNLTDSERRILASKVSNTVEQVEGVNRASVIVARAGFNQMGFTQKTGNTTANPAQKNLATNPMASFPDINSNNPNALTDDNNRNMAVPGGGFIVIIGTSVSEKISDDSEAWNKIKETITEKVTASDGRISQVYITKDPETISKIDELAAAALQGKVSDDYEDEIKDILNEVNTP